MQAHLDGAVRVFTFKEGLLSRVAHDLCLDVGRFQVKVDDDAVAATFEIESLTVDGVMKKGRLDRTGLNKRDMGQIQRTIRTEIFQAQRHGLISFAGKRDGDRVSGTLEMKGRRAPIEFAVRGEGETVTGRVELRPSRWGIRPYKALLGAIKLKDRVVVEFELTPTAPEAQVANTTDTSA